MACLRSGLRRLFAWRVDPQDSPQVPLATAPDGMVREGTHAGRGEAGRSHGWYVLRAVRSAEPRELSVLLQLRRAADRGANPTGQLQRGAGPRLRAARRHHVDHRAGRRRARVLRRAVTATSRPPTRFRSARRCLSSCAGPTRARRFLLDSDFTSAGRHPDSDIFLDDVTVSRRHAEFYRHGDRFTVRDVGSLNGTYVNRERIEEAELFGRRRGADRQVPAAVHDPQSRSRQAPRTRSAGLRMTRAGAQHRPSARSSSASSSLTSAHPRSGSLRRRG